MESSWTRDRTHVPWRGRQILICYFIREAPCGLLWAEGNQDPTDSRKLLTSLHCLKEFKLGAARKRAISRDRFLADSPTWRGTYLLFSSSRYLPFSPLKPQGHTFVYQNAIQASITWLPLGFTLEQGGVFIFFMESHTYKICFSPVALSYINLIFTPAKDPRRVEGKIFLSLQVLN